MFLFNRPSWSPLEELVRDFRLERLYTAMAGYSSRDTMGHPLVWPTAITTVPVTSNLPEERSTWDPVDRSSPAPQPLTRRETQLTGLLGMGLLCLDLSLSLPILLALSARDLLSTLASSQSSQFDPTETRPESYYSPKLESV